MIRKIAGTFSTKFLGAIINLIVVILTTRYLGAEGKGTTSLIVANITLIILLSHFIGGTALVYLVPRVKTILLILPSYLWAILSSGIGTTLLVLFGQVKNNMIIHIFFLSVILSIFSIHQMILMGKEKIKWHNILFLIQLFITLFSLIYFFLFKQDRAIHTFIMAIYGAYGLSLFASFFVVLKYFTPFTFLELKESIRQTISYGFVAQISSVISFFNYRLSYYLLKEWENMSSVGVYSTGVSIAEATWMLSKSIALVQYSKIANEKDNAKSILLTNSLTKLSFWTAFAIVFVLVLIPPVVYEYIFGIGFGTINKVIWSLAIGILSISYSTTFLHYFSGKGNYKIVNIATGIAFFFTIVLSIFLLPKYGIIGAGITASIAYLGQSIFLFIMYKKETSFNFLELFLLKKELNLLFKKVNR